MTRAELDKIILSGESETVEFKETTGRRLDACQTLCAFLNGRGGVVVFGVSHKGVLTGQLVSDSTRRDLFEAFERFEPAVDIVTEWIPIDATHQAIVCRVDTGNNGPYIFEGRAYKRIQSSTTIMSQAEYESILLARGGFRSRWELMPNPLLELGDLDLDEIRKTARMAVAVGRLDGSVNIDDASDLLKRFRLCRNKQLLNGAAVLFGKDDMLDYPQCQLKMGWFKTAHKTDFDDNRHVFGNVFKLINEGMAFCFKHLNLAAHIGGRIERREKLEIPADALREAIVNALVHRSYERSGATVTLAIYSDRVEIVNPGLFPPDMSPGELVSGHESDPRNPAIAHVLYLRKTIETWGRGMGVINAECKRANVALPTMEHRGNSTAIIFLRPTGQMKQNMDGCFGELDKASAKVDMKQVDLDKNSVEVDKIRNLAINTINCNIPSLRADARKSAINVLVEIALHPYASIVQISENSCIPFGTVRHALAILKEVGIVFRIDGNRGGHWHIEWKMPNQL